MKLLHFEREDAHGAKAIVNPLQVTMVRPSDNDKAVIVHMGGIEIRVFGSLDDVARRIEQELIRL